MNNNKFIFNENQNLDQDQQLIDVYTAFIKRTTLEDCDREARKKDRGFD
jgi:hypothetical protein